MYKEKLYTRLIEYALVFFMILDFNTVYNYSVYDNMYFIKTILTLIFIILNIFNGKVKKIDLKNALYICGFYYIFIAFLYYIYDLDTKYRIQHK